MPHYEKHVFICTHARPPGDPKGSCGHKNAAQIRDFIKTELVQRNLHGKIRANQSGCLDQCGQGPAVVIYPEQVWYTCPTVEDAREIVESHLIGGVPVERLRLK